MAKQRMSSAARRHRQAMLEYERRLKPGANHSAYTFARDRDPCLPALSGVPEATVEV